MKIILLLILINSYFCQICSNIPEEDYKSIDFNVPIKFDVDPNKEICLEYTFTSNKNKIGLSFLKSNSYTVEVLIYDSYENIKNDGENYHSMNDSYIIGLQSPEFKEIDVNDFKEKIYIIIRETKNYYYSDYIKLFDSEVPFALQENSPITIKNFMSNKEYNFVFSSENSSILSYSSKTKGKKFVSIFINEQFIEQKKDDNDILIPFNSSSLNDKYRINIKIDSDEENIDQEFSIMYHENYQKYLQINKNQREKINYLGNDEQEQIFYFYVQIKENFDLSYTINFKLDYNAKINKYIEVITNQLSDLPDLNNYQFDDNELQATYDRDSDEYYRFYFKPSQQTFILIKVQINQLETYIAPNFFNISYSGPVTTLKITDSSQKIEPQLSPYYINFYVDGEKNYLFSAPYELYCVLLKGDILENNNINTNYIDELSDLHEIGIDSKSFTAVIYSETKEINFKFQEYEPNDVLILNLNTRIKEAFNKTYTKEECNGTNKYIIFKYDIEYYSIGQNILSNYWMTDGDMDIYYKNSIEGNNFFPEDSSVYKLENETLYDSKTHLDIFTIKCKSPGTFYVRPERKEFKENTHIIKNNSINKMEIYFGTEIIQLYSLIKDAPPHIYFSILTLNESIITITPDTPGLFKETTINKNSKLFTLEINTKSYKMDQMAIKLTSNSTNEIEVTETTDCEYCKYQKISEIKNEKDLVINKRNFVIFLKEEVTNISITFNNLSEEEVAYAIVDLFSEDINYIPLAYNFLQAKIAKLEKTLEISTESNKNKDKNKPYKAFIFSLIEEKIPKYKIDITFKINNSNLFDLILLISLSIALLIAILVSLFYIYKNRNKYKKDGQIDENLDGLLE